MTDPAQARLEELQAQHDAEFAAQREADREALAKQEAANYLRTHNAEAALEYQNLISTRVEIHQPEQDEE